MTLKNVFIFFLVIGSTCTAAAQDPAEVLSIGKKEVIHSKILNEARNVHIFLPEGYSSSTIKYPVLYMLYSVPADYHFNTGIVSGLNRLRLIPKIITVAFDLGDGKRDLTPTKSRAYGPTSGGAGPFLKYVKEELIPFIDKTYRTKPERMFWSHSIGGLFGIYALLKEADLFQTVLVSSPFFVYDGDGRYLINNTQNFLKKREGQINFLYICVGKEPRLISEIKSFLDILKREKPTGLTWKYEEMPEENHMSILARSLTEGLRAYGSK
jgi:predicted alpha/beta superfamily hydrolase